MKLAIACLLFVMGCGGGIKPLAQPVNVPFPSELQKRTVFTTVGVYQKNLSSLVGHVLYAKKLPDGTCPAVYSDADLGARVFLKAGAKIIPNNEATLRYQSKLDQGAAAQASYLAFAAHLSAEQRAEVVVTDTTFVNAGDDDIDVDALEQLASTPPAEGYCDRFFVRGAVLTTVIHKLFTEIAADAQASGDIFGAGGKAYASSNEYALDFMLGLSILPVQKGIDPKKSPALAAAGAGRNPLSGLKIPPNGFAQRQD